MKGKLKKHPRILAIAPSTRGFGYAFFEGKEKLVEKGVKTIERNKNVQSLVKIKEMINGYQPDVLVLEDVFAPGSRRWMRIRKLSDRIIDLAAKRKLRVKMFSREKWRQVLSIDVNATKQEAAVIIAQRFPEELAAILPAKRVFYEAEDHHMPAFDAVALALAYSAIEQVRDSLMSHR